MSAWVEALRLRIQTTAKQPVIQGSETAGVLPSCLAIVGLNNIGLFATTMTGAARSPLARARALAPQSYQKAMRYAMSGIARSGGTAGDGWSPS